MTRGRSIETSSQTNETGIQGQWVLDRSSGRTALRLAWVAALAERATPIARAA